MLFLFSMKKEEISLMSLSQIRLFLKIWGAPGRRTIVSGKGEGGTVKELYRKNYVRPTGRIARSVRWAINEEIFTKEDIALMRELAK